MSGYSIEKMGKVIAEEIGTVARQIERANGLREKLLAEAEVANDLKLAELAIGNIRDFPGGLTVAEAHDKAEAVMAALMDRYNARLRGEGR